MNIELIVFLVALVIAAAVVFVLHLSMYLNNVSELAYCVSTGNAHVDPLARGRNDVNLSRRQSVLYGVIFVVVFALSTTGIIGQFF